MRRPGESLLTSRQRTKAVPIVAGPWEETVGGLVDLTRARSLPEMTGSGLDGATRLPAWQGS